MRNRKSPISKHALYRQITRSLQRDQTDIHLAQNSAKMPGDLLRTGTDDNAIRTRRHAAGMIQIFGNFKTQRRFALRVALIQKQL